MSHHVHTLPAEAQTSEIDHVRIGRKIIEPGSFIHAVVEYGTTDTDGAFQPHVLEQGSGERTLPIDDMQALRDSPSVNDVAPDTKADPQSQMDKDIAAFADNNALWHTQQ